MMPLRPFLLGLAIAIPATAGAQADSVAAVDRVFSWATSSSPGCAVGVARAGTPLLERAYGMANLEYDIANTPATVFEAGSVSKQFTAAAVVLLELDGKLSLDHAIRRYIPELPAYADSVTIRQMLNHTSGFRDWGSVVAMGGWPRGLKTYTNTHALEVAKRQGALNHAPGAEYIYSNTNYNLAAILVERVSGQPFATFTKERLFTPLGMTQTAWRDDYTRIVKQRATAYGPAADGFRQMMPFENVHGNGGLLTTVGDLLKWNEALTRGTVAGGRLTPALETRGRLVNGRAIDYAVGLVHEDHRGIREISHGGATAGYRAYLARYPEQGLSVALLCNSAAANPARLARSVADAFLPAPVAQAGAAPGRVRVGAAQLDRHVGTYRSTLTGEPLRVERRDSLLVALGVGPLTPIDSVTFAAGGARGSFSGRGAQSTTFRLIAAGDTTTWERVDAWTPSPDERQALAGRYVSAEAGGAYGVREKNGALALHVEGAFEVPLSPTYRDAFMAPRLGFVRVRRDATGRVIALLVTSDRARDVRFERQ